MNKKVLVPLFVVFLGLIILNKKPKMNIDKLFLKYGEDKKNKFLKVYNALLSLPISKDKLKFVLAQVLAETGVFSELSNVFTLNNNASGIFYSGSKAQLANGATKGTKRPSKEGLYYAKFNNLNDWAKEYYRVLNKGSMPLRAINIDDYANKLKQNNYFTSDLEPYKKNLRFFHDYITKLGI